LMEDKSMRMRALAALCLLALLAVSCSRPQAAQLPIEQRVGWIDSNCLAIDNKTLAEGTPLTVVAFGDNESLIDAKVVRPTQSAALCPPLHVDRRAANSTNFSFYEVGPSDGRRIESGIGLIGNVSRVGVGIDADGDGSADHFTHCTSSEGIWFGVWKDAPYKAKSLWSGYYYLGYDVDPTCPPQVRP